jgi:manganese transport protein
MQKLSSYFSKVVGPSAFMAAGAMGAGSTSSLILAGAWFGYELLWVALFILPLFVIAVDSASRIGLVNKDKGMFSLICEHIHPGVAWLILAINVPVHLFIAMGHMSIMTSAALSLFGYNPLDGSMGETGASNYLIAEIILSLVFAAGMVWLLVSEGYQRVQKVMTGFLLLMFICFFIVAVRGFQEIAAILSGFVPAIPEDLQVPSQDIVRSSGISIIAIMGSVFAPAALLGIPYMSADNLQTSAADFKHEFRKSVINLGLIYGGFSLFVIIAGGFSLFPLANNGEIDSVHEASKILVRAFPQGLEFLGPMIFSIGMVMVAMTTFVVVVEVISYFILDMFGYTWHHTKDNKRFKNTIIICVIAPALLAPFWSFPALFKNLLLMGVNVIVIPLVFIAVILLVNNKSVMGEHTVNLPRNIMLVAALVLSVSMTIIQLPAFIKIFMG